MEDKEKRINSDRRTVNVCFIVVIILVSITAYLVYEYFDFGKNSQIKEKGNNINAIMKNI